jgi:hypothetical protein
MIAPELLHRLVTRRLRGQGADGTKFRVFTALAIH